MGQTEQAEAMISLLLEFAQEKNYPAAITVAQSCQARLSLMQGDLESAVHWLAMTDLAADPSVMFFWLEVPHITQCRIMIAEGSEASLQEAGEKLAVYEKTNKVQNNTRQLIDILLLQSMVYQKQSQSDKALTTLTHAFSLAEPGGVIWPFLELGSEMAGLLVRLRQKGVAQNYIVRILAAFPDDTKGEKHLRVVYDADSSLVEQLTPRELDVLALLAQGLTNKEIAQQLVITPGTVRQHTNNLYKKLKVNNRLQAVAKASDLEIRFPE
jgi:LuxR family maltose regulon positive regulatory protein